MPLSLRLLTALALLLLAAPTALALDDIEAEGPITALTDTSLTVDGVTFALTTDTEVRDEAGPASVDDLAMGLAVDVRGSADASGVLVATRIEIEDENDDSDHGIRLDGAITERADSAIRVGTVWVLLTDATEIRGDDAPATSDDLVIGLRVEVRGALDADGQVVASRVTIEDDGGDDEEAKGLIESLADASLTVAGTTFAVTDSTCIQADDDTTQVPFEALTVGELVEVHGRYAADGLLVATRIEIEDFEDDEVELTGAIESLEASALTVAGLRFEVSDATVVLDTDRLPIPFDGLVVGLVVEIRADVDAAGGRRATRIQVEERIEDEVELTASLDAVGDGVVVALGLAFGVDSTTVQPGGLAAGDVVEIHATLSPAGDLFATGIEHEDAPASAVRLTAPVTATGADSLSVLGVPFAVDTATVLVGRDGSPTTLNAILTGASVRVDVIENGAGWLATRVEVRSAAQAMGRVASADASGFAVGGLAVRLASTTRIVTPTGQPVGAVEAGQTVAAFGTTGPDGLRADRVVVLSQATSVATEADRTASAVSLSVAPNPLSGLGRIRLTLAAPAEVQVVIFSALGREVARLGRSSQAAGTSDTALDTSGLPSGIYLVRVLVDGRPTGAVPLTVVR